MEDERKRMLSAWQGSPVMNFKIRIPFTSYSQDKNVYTSPCSDVIALVLNWMRSVLSQFCMKYV